MKYLFIGTALLCSYLISFNIYATDCTTHPIFCQIIKNKPSIDRAKAMKLSNIIYRISIQYQIPANIFAAILMQESGYRVSAKGTAIGLRLESNAELKQRIKTCKLTTLEGCDDLAHQYIEDRIYTDFGIAQIHYTTVERFQFNIERLISDLEYSVEAGAIVLSDFRKQYAKTENDWWTRYNASNRIKRNVYKELVERYL